MSWYRFMKKIAIPVKRQLMKQCSRNTCTNVQNKGLKILFFGTDDFSLKHLQALHSQSCACSGLDVVVPKVQERGKKCDVAVYAEKHELNLKEWPVSVEHGCYDVGIIVSFGHLIPNKIIQAFQCGALNVHPSLLPRWRGAAPIQHTILSGDLQTAVSIMQIMPRRFDIGPILAQRQYEVPPDISLSELRASLALMGSEMLVEVLKDLKHYQENSCPQSDVGSTHAFKFLPKHLRVNWEKQTASDIDRHYRAVGIMFGLRSEFCGKPIRLHGMVPRKSFTPPAHYDSNIPGSIHYDRGNDWLYIRCKDGFVGFYSVTLKKPMSAKSFYNGYLSKQAYRNSSLVSLENNLQIYFESASPG